MASSIFLEAIFVIYKLGKIWYNIFIHNYTNITI